MSKNYYLVRECSCCGIKETIHIGKSVGGWKFMFRGYRDNTELRFIQKGQKGIRCFKEWKEFLLHMISPAAVLGFKKEGFWIEDDGGNEISFVEFVEAVEATMFGKCHIEFLLKNYPDEVVQGNILSDDDGGYAIMFGNFLKHN